VRNADINRTTQWTVKLQKITFDEKRHSGNAKAPVYMLKTANSKAWQVKSYNKQKR
jgi:hypothetical protein